MLQPLQQVEPLVVVQAEEEVLVEAQEQIHQVHEEVEDGKNNKEYPKGYGRSGMDSPWNVYCLGCFGWKRKDYCWLWNYSYNWSLGTYEPYSK
jgi:hypothetical protein